MPNDLILASTSPYRERLLRRLQPPGFLTVAPEVDESPRPGEGSGELARRLAIAKADTVARRFPRALVIGSDQTADVAGTRLEKPGTHDKAMGQLLACSGQRVVFFTAVALCRQEPALLLHEVVTTEVTFRTFDDAEAEHYLLAEQPYDCAGSFKCEGLGVTLFEAIRSDDPTALEGLPLIALCDLLRRAGTPPLGWLQRRG